MGDQNNAFYGQGIMAANEVHRFFCCGQQNKSLTPSSLLFATAFDMLAYRKLINCHEIHTKTIVKLFNSLCGNSN